MPLATAALPAVLAQVRVFPPRSPLPFIWSLVPSSSLPRSGASALFAGQPRGNQIRKSQWHYKTCLV